ncbi:hypothetical protein [Weissella muntiaci]|nr:hypothetical protein [Weissella muntiaci]
MKRDKDYGLVSGSDELQILRRLEDELSNDQWKPKMNNAFHVV